MSTPDNPNDPGGQQSTNQPWDQQPADPYAGRPSWGDQSQPPADQWGDQPQSATQWSGQSQQPADQWSNQQASYSGQYGQQEGQQGQQSDPYAAQYGQQQWTGQYQQPGMTSSDGKSFFSSLFDFNFQSFVTPKIIKVVYVVITALIGLGVLIFLISALISGEPLAIIAALILGPIVGLIYLALARMSLELYYAVIRLAEDVHERLPRQ